MPRGDKKHRSAPGTWTRDAPTGPKPRPDLKDPAVRRRRALAILSLVRQGFTADELAVWFDLSSVRIRQLRRKAERLVGFRVE